MTGVPDVLGGLTMPAEESERLLAQIGRVTDSRIGGRCNACMRPVGIGELIARCLKFGWAHLACVNAERAKAGLPPIEKPAPRRRRRTG